MSKQRIGAAGLWFDPGPLGEIPPGAMRIADEVVIRRQGVVEPRPGIDTLSSEGINSFEGLFSVDGDLLMLADGGASQTWWLSDLVTPVQDGTGVDLQWTANRYAVSRPEDTIYLNTADGVRKLTAAGELEAFRAGLPRPALKSLGGAVGTTIAVGKAVAYRVTVRRRENGRLLRGAPSGRYVIDNDSGVNVTMTVRAVWPPAGESSDDELQVDDVIELWRSFQVDGSINPSDELFLAGEHPLTTADLSARYVDITDANADVDLGAPLYTNPAYGGAVRENNRPPACKTMDVYKGSLFFGGTTGPHRMQLDYTEGGDCSGDADGIGYRTYTGTRTNLSAQITAMSSTTGLKVGMMLADPSAWSGAAGVPITIVSVDSATAVTMSGTGVGTSVGASFTFYDTIAIDAGGGGGDQIFPAVYAYALVATMLADDSTLSTSMHEKVAAFGVGEVSRTSATSGDVAGSRTVFLEKILPDGNMFEVSATHGSEYTPPLPEISAAAKLDSAQDDRPLGISWSKSREYEHVPEADTNYAIIPGVDSEQILRIITAQDALWIFTVRGLWRLTGDGELSGWRIESVDPSLALLAPASVCVLDDVVYAWTSRGIVSIAGNGIVPLSEPRFGSALADIQLALHQSPVSTPAAFAFAMPRTQEVCFAIPDSYGGTVASSLYVFNARTRTWVRWFAGSDSYKCGTVNASTGAFVLGHDGVGKLDTERAGASPAWQRLCDVDYSITIAGVASSVNITINSGSGWTPALGDVVYQGTSRYVVVGVTSTAESPVFEVHASGLTTGAATAFAAFTSRVEWVAQFDAAPSLTKMFLATVNHFSSLKGMIGYTAAYSSSVSRTRAEVERDLAVTTAFQDDDSDPGSYGDAAEAPRDDRMHVPRSHSQVTQLFPSVEITQAGAAWAMDGITVEAEVLGEGTVR